MDKIIFKALELAGFKNASVIADVISSTPNPTVATEMLLGVYEPMTVQSFGQHWKHRYNDVIYSVVSIDELRKEVLVNSYKPKTAYMYYETSDEYRSDINGVWEQGKRPGVKYADYRSKKVPGVIPSELKLSLDAFGDDYKPISNEEFVDTYNNWAYDASQDVPSPVVTELSDNLPF